eukprot:6139099-Pleurochrysis_carterae.AAC.1
MCMRASPQVDFGRDRTTLQDLLKVDKIYGKARRRASAIQKATELPAAFPKLIEKLSVVAIKYRETCPIHCARRHEQHFEVFPRELTPKQYLLHCIS